MKTVAQIRDDATKEECFAIILPAQLRAGDIAGAKKTAAELGDERYGANQGIAEVQAKTGDLAGAKETAARITDKSMKAHTYYMIAVVRAVAGDAAESKATAAEIGDEALQARVYRALARADERRGHSRRP